MRILEKKMVWFFFLLMSLSTFCISAQTTTYRFDQVESKISFEVSHLGFLTATGNFEKFSGNMVLEENSLQSVHCSIQVESIYTNDKARDKTLKSEAYLDVAAYPNITFSSGAIIQRDRKVMVSGFLQIKNVRKPVDLVFESDMKEEWVELKSNAIVYRTDFELDFGAMDGLIGENIKVHLHLKALRNQ